MASTVEQQIQVVETDNNGIETDLTPNSILTTYTKKNNFESSLENADKYIDLPISDSCLSLDLYSDYGLNIAIYESNTLKIEVKNVTHFSFTFSQGSDLTYKIKNISGYTANIVWRAYS